MRYSIVTVILSIFLLSCGNNGAEESSAAEEATTKQEPAMAEATGPVDPICDMVKGDNWTEYYVNATDTVWFCSPHCQEVYEANPEKYSKG